MFERCNASCVTEAKKSLLQHDNIARPNPHLDGLPQDAAHRAATFIPIFLAIAALIGGGYAVAAVYAPAITAQQEALEEFVTRSKVRLQRRFPKLAPLIAGCTISKLGAVFICMYYVNEVCSHHAMAFRAAHPC